MMKLSTVYYCIILGQASAAADIRPARLLQILPSVKSSYYVVDWQISEGDDCASHLLSVDLECRNGNTQVVSSSNATCTRLTEDWVRCTATNNQTTASVQVKCVGDSIPALALLAKSVPFSIPCYDFSSPSILLSIRQLCPSASNSSEWTLQDVRYTCRNASPLEDGTCSSKEYITCTMVTDPVPFLACDRFDPFGVLAVVYYSSIEDGTCLLDEQDNDLQSTPNDSQRPPNDTAASTQEGDRKEATYQVYFETVVTETSRDCLFPSPNVLLLCGSGNPPTLKRVERTSCYGIETRDGVVMARCFVVEEGVDGSVQASCSGTSEASRELFAYMDQQTLTHCKNGTEEQVAGNVIWMSEVCENDLVWGEKRKCLQGTTNEFVSSGGFDVCQSSYDCGNTSCTGSEMIVSASVNNDLCLENADETSPRTSPSHMSDTQGDSSAGGEADLTGGVAASSGYRMKAAALVGVVGQLWLLGSTYL